MKIAVVQASSQISKNNMLYSYTKKYAKDDDVINFGCFSDDEEKYSYIEISILIGTDNLALFPVPKVSLMKASKLFLVLFSSTLNE